MEMTPIELTDEEEKEMLLPQPLHGTSLTTETPPLSAVHKDPIDDDGYRLGICSLSSRSASRTLALSAVILAVTCYFAVEVGHASLTPFSSPAPPAGRTQSLGYETSSFEPPTPLADDRTRLLARLVAAKAQAETTRKSLYEKHAPFSADLFPTVTLFNATQLQRRLAQALVTESPFVIGVMGTSVTAGHDNFFNQSFPVVWGRIMEPAFAAAGVNLTTRNHAMGWNPIHPSYFCVGEMVGQDADVVVWEFGMMGGGDDQAETYLRNALNLPKQPHVLFLDPGLGARDDAKEPREGKPNPWKTRPMEWYTEMGFSIASQVMEHAYWRTDHMPQYNSFSIIAKDKPTERPAGWHPGPHGHELRAEILAYNYLGYLIDTIDILHTVVSGGGRPEALMPQRITMDKPKECKPDLCEHSPQCLTTFVPRAGESLLTKVVHPKEIPHVTDGAIAGENKQEGWHTQLYFCDVGAIDYMLRKGFNYLDRKIVLQGNNHDGPLRMDFETTRESYLVFCSAPGNKHMCKSSEWRIDGEKVDCIDKDTGEPKGMTWVEEPCFITPHKYPAGKHTWELTMTEPFTDHDNFIPVSHLIWW